MSSDFNFSSHKEKATSEFQEVRGLYEDLSKTIKKILSESLKSSGVKYHSIEARAKSIKSFAEKACKPSDDNPNTPKYRDPLTEITDLSAARIITFLPGEIENACNTIEQEFSIIEKTNKADELIDEGKFGYHSIHYLLNIPESRTSLPEYRRFSNITFEIQVRTILQHAWAEMEHDIQYKSSSVIPTAIKRRFTALAGMLEIADREFQALQEEDNSLRIKARDSVASGNLAGVEITPDALKTYLDKRLGKDARQTEASYEISARLLKKLGFTSVKQLDDCLEGYDDDAISRAIWGNRQGQLNRLDDTLLASMGEVFIDRHPWSQEEFWSEKFPEWLETLKESGVPTGSFDPLNYSK